MSRSAFATTARRPAALPRLVATIGFVLVVAPLALAGALVAPSAVAATTDIPLAQAESQLISLMNRDRASAGLVPVRVDPRLTAIARERSADMAARGYFAHVQPDGRDVFDLIVERGIAWYGAGEILAWNTHGALADAALAADQGWLASPGHRPILLSSGYNYVGVGLAIDATGRRVWTALFMKGPDRTGAVARVGTPVRTTGTLASGTVGVRVSWRGGDVRLQVLTAGLRDFQVQRRVDGGAWQLARAATSATSMTGSYRTGHRYEFRVRARDRAGNVGAWTTPVAISV